jgi:hypothetical protein
MIETALTDLWYGFGVALQPHNLMWCFIGVLVPTLPEIRIYTAHPASGLWRLAELDEDGSGPSPLRLWDSSFASALMGVRRPVIRSPVRASTLPD